MKKLLIILLLQANLCFAHNIALDVGHSLNVPGAISALGDSEFSYNQGMAYAISKQLANNGNKVNLIGYQGNISKLSDRTALAIGNDLFISIHHDSVHEDDLTNWNYNGQKLRFNDNVRGFSIFVSTKNTNLQQSLFCASKVAESLLEVGFIPNYYHNTTTKNKKRDLFFKNKPVYQYDNLAVLRSATMPAILIEAGVIINRYEAKWIAQEEVKTAFSKAVATGIKDCMN